MDLAFADLWLDELGIFKVAELANARFVVRIRECFLRIFFANVLIVNLVSTLKAQRFYI